MSRDFDWNDSDSVVLRAYGSIAVHENLCGDVVIRQERDALEEDDHFVVVPVQDAELVAQAILDKAKEIKSGWDARQQPEQRLALPAPTKPTPKNGELRLEGGTRVVRNGGGRHE